MSYTRQCRRSLRDDPTSLASSARKRPHGARRFASTSAMPGRAGDATRSSSDHNVTPARTGLKLPLQHEQSKLQNVHAGWVPTAAVASHYCRVPTRGPTVDVHMPRRRRGPSGFRVPCHEGNRGPTILRARGRTTAPESEADLRSSLSGFMLGTPHRWRFLAESRLTLVVFLGRCRSETVVA